MKLISWNVNGLRACVQKGFLDFFQESLSRLIRNKTVMIIAHRMRTVADADKIVVLKDGVVAEQGTPAELEAKDGIYRHMKATQMEAADWKL